MKRFFVLFSVVLQCMMLSALSQMGEWEAYLSYQSTDAVEANTENVFALANGHLYAVNRKTGLCKSFSKMDGLSDNTIQLFGYSEQADVMVLVYANANIDLMTNNNTVYNIPDIKDKNWSVDKTIYQIYFEDDYAFLACGFGVVVIDLTKKEIKDTYIIGQNAQKVPIYGFAGDEDYYYALSENQVFRALKKNSNLLDFNVWQDSPIDLPIYMSLRKLYAANGTLLSIHETSTIMQYSNGQWKTFYEGDPKTVSWRKSGSNYYVTGGSKGINVYSSDLQLLQTYNLYALDALRVDNDIWFAVSAQGLGQYNVVHGLTLHLPSSIPHVPLKEVAFRDDELYVASGGYWIDRFQNACVIPYLKNGQWKQHTAYTMQTSKWTNFVYDVTSIAFHPSQANTFYFSSWGEGLFEVTNGIITRQFNESNTNGALTSAIPGNDHYVRVDGLQFDDLGNLWMLNAMSGIKVLDKNQQWHQLTYPPLQNCPGLRHLLLGSKLNWCVDARYMPGVFVFSHNGTIDDMSDDKYRFFGAGQFVDKDGNALSPNYVYDIDEGTDGAVWVATDIGPIVFTATNKVFDRNYRCTRIKIPRNDGTGLADYLLDGVSVLTVAIDAGNRKWLGTSDNGVYLLSPDGKETLLHFTTENSPLSSNEVLDIAIQELTGEVFFSTPDGLFSYRSDALQAEEIASNQTVYAFPNPVRPEYGGLITIAGLEADSKVWITDASANVVFEGISNGGSLSWNGRNASGQMVSGGVYFVLVSNADSNQHRSVATKILIVR